jgi:uncharacterized protein (TIGR00159 family)
MEKELSQLVSSFLTALHQNFRVADFFDIGIISVFIYSILIWFKETTSRSVLFGLFLLTMVYVSARIFDLYLTTIIFQSAFAVLVFGLVVVFQEEIRRFFERVAIVGSFRDRRRQRTSYPSVDMLIETVSDLAARRVGALIVIRGKEPLERHYVGGVPLYGRLSRPLLDSIFDPYSSGHDGAVIIEGDRVTKFSAHLPLSKNLNEIKNLGTRHTSALGISECSDAMAIVVSEERGTISLAEAGSIRHMESAAELKGRLEKFYAEKFPKKSESVFESIVKKNTLIKILALSLAVIFWFFIAYRTDTIRRVFDVPIEYRNLPQDWVIEEPRLTQAKVTLSGSERAFDLLNTKDLIISLDLSNVKEGLDDFLLTDNELRHPLNVSVYSIEPNIVHLEAHQVKAVELPIVMQTRGKLKTGLKLYSVTINPSKIKVRGHVNKIEGLDKLYTEIVDFDRLTENATFNSQIIFPEGIQAVEGSVQKVEVTLEIDDEKREAIAPKPEKNEKSEKKGT